MAKTSTASAAKKPAAKKSAKKPAEAKKLNILFATAEAFPYAGTGGLGEVAGSLPKALNRLGADARVIMPLYGSVAQKYREKMTYILNINIAVGWRNQYCGLFRLENDGVVTYFVDNEYYFKRDGLYGHFDDCERFAFFSRAVLELLPMLDFKPDIIHSNDHATALIPMYYATEYWSRHGYTGIKNVFTIHNLEYQGCYPGFMLGDVFGIAEHNRGLIDFNYQINCVKGAIETAHTVSTVSPTYAHEILTPDRSFGLSGILCRNSQKLFGILNGINTAEYDPQNSPSIAANFSPDDKAGKAACKAALKSECGFAASDKPVIAVISRLAGHKGLDLVKMLLERNGSAFDGADLVVLGTGERYLEEFFTRYADLHGNACAFITYNKDLAQRIYAGADMFLMPSASEPCGLSQMMACRYGTLPIVRRTGGLADSIIDCRGNDVGNGFVFDDYSPDALNAVIADAVSMYGTDEWASAVDRAMRCDFSWDKSAQVYMDMYRKTIERN